MSEERWRFVKEFLILYFKKCFVFQIFMIVFSVDNVHVYFPFVITYLHISYTRLFGRKKTLCRENDYNVMFFIMIQHFSTLSGAFLIPYFIMMVIEGLPLFYIEFAIGQRFQRSAIGCFKKIHPALTGIGISCIVISVLLCIYYVAVISWCFYYLFISLTSSLPFQMSNCEK